MSDLRATRRDLEAALGAEAVLTDPLALRLYARDASMVEGSAGLVAFPRSADDIAACMGIAAAHGLPVVPRGSGTGLAGAADADRRFPRDRHHQDEPHPGGSTRGPSRLGRARRPQSGSCERARADRLHLRARSPPAGQFDRRQRGTNAGGPHCLAYGVTAPTSWRSRSCCPTARPPGSGAKDPTGPGYDLRGVLVGSEGTLGIVTAACVRLTPIAPAVRRAAGLRRGPRLRGDRVGDRRRAASCPPHWR